MSKTITLSAREVLKLKKIDDEPRKDKNDKDYYRFAKGSTVFTADAAFKRAWDNGEIYEMDLEEKQETGENGETITRLQVGGFISNKQILAVTNQEMEIKRIEKKLEKEFSLEKLAETV